MANKLAEQFWKKYIGAALVLALFLVLPIMIFWPVLFGGKIFEEPFVREFFYPLFSFSSDFLKTHNSPSLWVDGYLSGFPVWLGLNDTLYLPAIIFARTFSFLAGYHWLLLLHVGLGGFFAYLFARSILLSRTASFIVGFVYLFSRITLQYAPLLSFAVATAVLPLFFLSVTKIFLGQKKWILFGGIALAFGLVGGFTEVILFSSVVAFFFALYLDIFRFRQRGDLKIVPRARIPSLLLDFKTTWCYAATILLGGVLAGPWLLPAVNFIRLGVRVSNGLGGEILSGPSGFGGITTFFYPYFSLPRAGFFEGWFYVGILPLIFVVASLLFWKKQPLIKFFSVAALFGILLNLSPSFFELLYKLPILNLFRGPYKWLYAASFCLAVLAGMGFERLFYALQERDATELKRIRIFFASAIIFLGVLLLSILVLAGIYVPELFLTSRLARTFIITGIAVALTGCIIVLAKDGKYRIFLPALPFLVLGIILFDFFLSWRGLYKFLPERSALPKTSFFFQKVSSQNDNQNEPFRYRRFNPSAHQIFGLRNDELRADFDKEALEPNLNLLDEVASIDGQWENMITRRHMNLLSLVSQPPERFGDEQLLRRKDEIFSSRVWKDIEDMNSELLDLPREKIVQMLFPAFRAAARAMDYHDPETINLLSMMNVRYVSSSFQFHDPWKKMFWARSPVETRTASGEKSGNVLVYFYENPFVLPRVYFAKTARLVEKDEKTALEQLKTISDFHKETLVECEHRRCFTQAESSESENDQVEIQEHYSGYLRLKTRTNNPRWLVYSESNLPTWEARIDGNLSDIETANYIYQAVYVPAGEHEVEFRYPGVWAQFRYALGDLLSR